MTELWYLRSKHVRCQIRLLLNHLKCELWPLLDLVANNLLHLHKLSLLEITDDLGIRMGVCFLYDFQLFASYIFD
jgi:hypothetical protein